LARFAWGLVIRLTGGPTDLTRDYEFTDWRSLQLQVKDFLAEAVRCMARAA
jgi:hypothetical protein